MNHSLFRISAIVLFLLLSLFASAQPNELDKKSLKQFEKAKEAYQARNNQDAMDLLLSIIERSPNYPDAHMMKFQIHQEERQYDLAKKELEKVTEISPNFFPNAHLFLGRIYLSEGDYQKSIDRLTHFLKYRDNQQNLNAEAQVHLANCYYALEAMKNPVPFEPRSMGESINSANSEYFPSLTANDKTILFTRRLKIPNTEIEQEDFFISQKENGLWQPAKPLRFINTSGNEGAPSIAPDGELIVFTACENVYGEYGGSRRGLGSCDLFYSFREGDSWTKPRNMGEKINSRNWETQPSLSADGRTLYFVRAQKKKEGIRNLDIYSSTLGNDGLWTTAVKLNDVINTPRDESSVLIHPDGNTLYFTSDGHMGMGGEDVFLSRKDANGEWGKPMNLGYPINTANNENSLVVSASGSIAYFASDREGGMGGLDLYEFDLYPEAQPLEVSYMEGFVYDSETKKPVQALFQLIDVSNGDVMIESYSNAIDGKFLVTLPTQKEYALNVSSPEYLFYSDHFSFTKGSKSEPFILDVPLSKLKSGLSLVLENIFFDTDKFELKAESGIELKKLFGFMTNNPEIKIEISGHTDNVGAESYNKELSHNRAQSVMDELVLMGISKERMNAIGYGSTKPITDNKTEVDKAKNRRTEIKIL